MKNIYTFILLSFVLFSCNSDDVDCTSEPIFNGAIVIELVNVDGENLIENGAYNAEDITIAFNDSLLTGVVTTDLPEIANRIVLNIFGEDGDNTFDINLSDTETDELVLNLTREATGGQCSQFALTLNTALYNSETIELQNSDVGYLMTIVKE
jgi:hypothetical protein